MANRKKKPVATKTQNRTGTSKTFWIEDQLYAAILDYKASQEVEPKERAIFSAALKMFLASKGFWPPKDQEDAGDD